jgi:hypothetical protein
LCSPCRPDCARRAESKWPLFRAVSEELGDEIILFGLDVGPLTNLGSSEDGQALIQELGVTYPASTTTDAQVMREYGLSGMPTTYFFTPDVEGVQHYLWVRRAHLRGIRGAGLVPLPASPALQ